MKDMIVLIGYRAVGKTTIGKLLAERLSYLFVDTDKLICEEVGRPIAQIVKEEGWEKFRFYEQEALSKIAGRNKTVVATGGGAVLHGKEVWSVIKQAASVVWLTADHEVIISRIVKDNSSDVTRPSLSGKDVADEVRDILEQRIPLYTRLADISVDTGKMTPVQIADHVLHLFE